MKGQFLRIFISRRHIKKHTNFKFNLKHLTKINLSKQFNITSFDPHFNKNTLKCFHI